MLKSPSHPRRQHRRASLVWIIVAACAAPMLRADGPAPANLVVSGDLSLFKPTLTVFAEGKQTRQEGWWIEHWSTPAPDESTSGEVVFTAEGVNGAKAVTLRKSAGIGPILFQYHPVRLIAGKSYALSFDYLTAGGSGAAKMESDRSQKEKAPSTQVALTDTAGQWKAISVRCGTAIDCDYALVLETYGIGPEHAISFRNLAVREAP